MAINFQRDILKNIYHTTFQEKVFEADKQLPKLELSRQRLGMLCLYAARERIPHREVNRAGYRGYRDGAMFTENLLEARLFSDLLSSLRDEG